jgi:hypothetical protein
MSLLTKKRLILAKIEGSYGVDPTPTGSEAMLVKNLDVQPLQADLVSRDLIKPYLGISEKLLAQKAVQISFEIEYAASGIVGGLPAYDALLRACGFVSAPTTTPMTSAAILSEVVTVTKAAHGLITGDKIITSGFTDTAANKAAGVTITKTGTDTFTFPAVGASDDPTADGTPVYRTQLAYTPLSASHESVTMYFNVDGVLHKSSGMRGTFEISLAVKQIPVFKFTFTGFYTAPTDTAAATPVFTGFTTPYLANTQNTPGFSLFSYSALLESFSLNLANNVSYVPLIGGESVKIIDRAPAGTLLFEAPTIAQKDYWSAVASNTLGSLTLSHGALNGYKVNLSIPNASLGNPTYQDSNGVQMLQTPFTAVPGSSGNDEVSVIYK